MDETLQTYEVYTAADTVVTEAEYEGTNASRFALLATLGPSAQRDRVGPALEVSTSDPLVRFGFNPEIRSRVNEGAPGEREYIDALNFLRSYRTGWESSEVRVRAWRSLNEQGDLSARLALLSAGLASPLERESATAASAVLTSVSAVENRDRRTLWRQWPFRFVDRQIDTFWLAGAAGEFDLPTEDGELGTPWPWAGDDWERYASSRLRNAIQEDDPSAFLAALHFLARFRANIGQRSSDPIVRELARAAFLNQVDDTFVPASGVAEGSSTGGSERVSTMIHGTWGWKGDWWYPDGDLHRYIKRDCRAELYDGGQEFSWSGAYSEKHRATGGLRFGRWAAAAGSPDGLGTVFAHSYGGEIVARAVNSGSRVDEVVLMSAPVHAHHVHMLSHVRRVVDVRLAFDIVLTAARAHQTLPSAPNVVRHVVDRPLWSHSATHDSELWEDEGIAANVGLT